MTTHTCLVEMMRMKQVTTKIGSHLNLTVDINFFDIEHRLSREHDLDKRIKIMDELQISNLEPTQILEIMTQFCGHKEEIMTYLMKCNKRLFVENIDPSMEMNYIRDYADRLSLQEDHKVRKDMVISLADLYDAKYNYLQEIGILHDVIRIETIRRIPNINELYKDLIRVFKYDRKTIDCLNKVYPDLLSEFDDKELGSKVIINMLSEIININLNFFDMISIFKNTALTLMIDEEWDVDDMRFLASEASYYIKRSIYSLTTVDELLNCVVYLSNEIHDASTEKEYILLSGFMNYINDIIEESIGLQFKPSKEHHTYSIIPIEELASIMNIINSRELNIFNDGNDEGIRFEIDAVAEVLDYYNQLNESSDSLSETISSINTDFISYLQKNQTPEYNLVKSDMKNVVSVLEWYDKLIVDNAMNLKATLLGLCTLIIEGVELYKREVIRTLNTYLDYKVISFNPSGFTTEDGIIDIYKYSDYRTKTIIKMIGNADTIRDKMLELSNKSNLKLMRALYGIAEVLGINYDNTAVKAFLKEKLFSKNNKKVFASELFELLFGTTTENTSFEKLYNLSNINSIIEVPILKKMDLGVLWQGYVLRENVDVVEEKKIVDEKMTFILDDVDLDYDFDDLLVDESVKIWNLTPFQILRQMKYDKLNLLTTSLYTEFTTYIIIYNILTQYEYRNM